MPRSTRLGTWTWRADSAPSQEVDRHRVPSARLKAPAALRVDGAYDRIGDIVGVHDRHLQRAVQRQHGDHAAGAATGTSPGTAYLSKALPAAR